MFEHSSPICRLSDGETIPVYLLPLSCKNKEAIYFWQASYHNHDSIWLDSADLETVAYKQLAEVNSGLSEQGRGICAKIEQATAIPTYYYIHRYYGRKNGENERRCPGCGQDWRVKDTTEPDNTFWGFTFKCEQCRLVSHLAFSTEDERRAIVGEYKESAN